jgi:phosphohistidine swiveling domain-containing protein
LSTYLARFGAYAPAWDVAVPCDDEDPDRLQAAAARRARGPEPATLAADARRRADEKLHRLGSIPGVDRALSALRRAIAEGETDDLVFFEGQRLVRRALLARGQALLSRGYLDAVTDVFDLPLVLAARDEDHRGIAETNRRARIAAGRQAPPYRIVDGHAELRLPASDDVLRGRGVGGRARGIAYVASTLTAPLDVPDGAILVVPAALPSLAPILPHLRALVTEHGGALSHAATLARELGLPAVVGAAGALKLPHGAEVYVDGERGRVLVLARPD